MHLLSLSIERIRAIDQLSLDLTTSLGGPRRRVVFLGANGSGKTTVLTAITHVFEELSAGGAVEMGARKLTAGDVRDSAAGLAALQTDPGVSRDGRLDMELALSSDERQAARRLVPDAPPRGSIQRTIGVDRRSLKEFLDELVYARQSVDTFFEIAKTATLDARPPCLLLPADRGILEPADATSIGELSSFDPRRQCLSPHRRRFEPVAARLAFAALDPKRHDTHGTVARMRKVIEKYFPDLPRPEDPADLTSPYRTQSGSLVQLEAMSDGERALWLILGEIALRPPNDGIILIDEPEQHLHPRWQRTLLEALSSLVPTAQLILATQSPYLAACAPDDVIKLGDWDRDGQ